MREIVLEFEKPIVNLQKQIDTLLESADDSAVSLSKEVKSLQSKLEKLKCDIYAHLKPWDRVQLARHPNRPYSLDYIERIFTDFLEFHGDRRYADDEAIIGGFAKLDGNPVMLIGTQKGRETRENVRRNFGCPHPEGYRKALRLMQVAELAQIPIITFVDTPGAFPGVASEERHIGEAIAVNLREMFGLTVPIICIVIGEGGSGGALGIACGNKVLLMENAYYSVITPEGCAAILWKDRKYSEVAADMLRLTAVHLQKLDVIDDVIKEPLGGAHHDFDQAAKNVKTAILTHLKPLQKCSADELVKQRYERFRKIGKFSE